MYKFKVIFSHLLVIGIVLASICYFGASPAAVIQAIGLSYILRFVMLWLFLQIYAAYPSARFILPAFIRIPDPQAKIKSEVNGHPATLKNEIIITACAYGWFCLMLYACPFGGSHPHIFLTYWKDLFQALWLTPIYLLQDIAGKYLVVDFNQSLEWNLAQNDLGALLYLLVAMFSGFLVIFDTAYVPLAALLLFRHGIEAWIQLMSRKAGIQPVDINLD